MIVWNERYAIGDEAIDRHHKTLFDFFNDFEARIKAGSGQSFLETTLEFMDNYVDVHFGIEEFCMHRHKCPVADKNHTAHVKFKEAFAGFRKKIDLDGYNEAIGTQMHQFLETWITQHIMGIDTRLKEVL